MSAAVEIKIEITGLEGMLKAPDMRPILRSITLAVGKLAQSKLSADPGPNAQPVTWQSEKQRIHYVLMRKAAGLPLKYDRETDPMSQQLEKSWLVENLGDTNAVVYTNVSYAKWVQSGAYQQAMHFVTGWTTDELVKRDLEGSGEVDTAMEQAVFQHYYETFGGWT